MSGFELDTTSYTLLTSILTAAALLSIHNTKGPDIHPLLLNTQSDVSRLRHPGESAIYRSRMYPNGSPLLSTFDRSMRTLCDLYEAGGLSKQRTSPFVGKYTDSGAWEWTTYEVISNKSKHVQAGLRTWAGLVPVSGNESSFVGIYASNSPETVAIGLACHCNGLVTVPISAQATSSHVSHVIKDTLLKVLAVDPVNLERALSLVPGTNVKYIVVLGSIDAANKDAAKKAGIELLTFKELEVLGQSSTVEAVRPGPNDVASIMFDSTSNQLSKSGAVLTQKNLLANVASYLMVLPPQQKITSNDRLLHNLPIDNVLGHTISSVFYYVGGSIAFEADEPKKDVKATLSKISEAKPTILVSGPHFLHQVKEVIESNYGNSFLFRRGFNKKLECFKEGRLVNDSKYDMLVFRDIRQTLFGGNLRVVFIDNDDNTEPIAPFLRAVLGVQVLKTFNRAETGGTMTASMFYDYNADTAACGAPLPCNELKLTDLTENGYTAEDKPNPRGEIWVRGNNVFSGYWNDPTSTSDVMDADGWFMTGMIGEVFPNGTVKLLGRK
ncbi:hypothetical protein J3Q64DRAFT_1726283 [Phycomyces blakesleeanus]|uniref:AMP-dependent synthetase/ligase domain-containing protein n=2 Tax=Phycomyces blakesleeanus TaxID=4837 RepID=A0A163BDQ5_PHYB8|nr:hypothetical protein PHYBLDRAFT_138467 [Phycomyces blakesleeanus NRRL 1555(-)]OAD80911.1 hypothetical protein PHYBLDRAFT_138467 [Phycomyces blakesleeanus NRRL 1555(-)]|eukprot:XP_018298951.1 hypothetical protein PHYBLDRAFT_138467 [Phycomyces blakesleeanus NRRL 1555(-)]